MRNLLLALTATMIVVGACVMGAGSDRSGVVVMKAPDPSGFRGAVLARPYDLPEVELIDTNARAYNLRTSPSRPVVLIYFGYTNCPDECTGVLSDLASAISRLGPGVRNDLQVLFITVDPPRDTPARIRGYLDRFSPEFTGLTGDREAIVTTARQLGLDVLPAQNRPEGGYEVPHSAQVIAFDRDRKGVVAWTPGTPVEDYRSDFTLLVDRQR